MNLLGALAVGVQDRLAAAMVEAADIDETAVTALLVVRARASQSITDVATALRLTHSGAVRVIDRCVTRGLVVRAEGRDRRSRGLVLSSDGEAVATRALAARRYALEELLDAIPASDRRSLARALERVLAHLPVSRGDAWRICRTCEHDVCRGPKCPVGYAVDQREGATR